MKTSLGGKNVPFIDLFLRCIILLSEYIATSWPGITTKVKLYGYDKFEAFNWVSYTLENTHRSTTSPLIFPPPKFHILYGATFLYILFDMMLCEYYIAYFDHVTVYITRMVHKWILELFLFFLVC